MRVGSVVTVKSLPDILDTLDDNGCTDGLPFQAEMGAFCGSAFEICADADSIYVEGEGFRHIADTFLLAGVRCDGSAHSMCRRRCLLMFKKDWLEEKIPEESAVPASSPCPAQTDAILGADHPCQGMSATLCKAGSPIALLDWAFLSIRLVRYGVRMHRRLRAGGMPGSAAPDPSPGQAAGSRRAIDIGSMVRVRPVVDIWPTLDRKGRNRGLHFSWHQFKYCTHEFRVLDKVVTLIDERVGQTRRLGDTYILEGVTCREFHCPRECYWLWRGEWLEPLSSSERHTHRIPSDAVSHDLGGR